MSPAPPRAEHRAPSRFARDTRLVRRGETRFEARIDPGWWIIQGPNGGYVAALITRALEAVVGDADRRPQSLTIHYLSPPVEGSAEIDVCVERSGRTMSSLTARLTQNGKLRALAIAAHGMARRSPSHFEGQMPEVQPPEQLTPRGEKPIPLSDRYEIRFLPGADPDSPDNRAMVAGWIRLTDPHRLDHALLAAYTDALPPTVFALEGSMERFGGVPTIDLTIHFRADPAEAGVAATDFCLAVFRSRLAHGGYVEEDGEIWSRDGLLLAQSRQLAVIMGG